MPAICPRDEKSAQGNLTICGLKESAPPVAGIHLDDVPLLPPQRRAAVKASFQAQFSLPVVEWRQMRPM